MIMKKQLILFATIVALTVAGVLNLGTIEVSAANYPAIYITPASVNVAGCSEIGSNYTFSIRTNYTGDDICGYEFALTYDQTVLEGIEVVNGDLITEAAHPNTTMWRPGDWNNTVGKLEQTGNNFYWNFTPPAPVVQGPGILANVTFNVTGCGISNIDFVESETRLIGYRYNDDLGWWEEYNILDEYFPLPGNHMEGSVFDHSANHDVAIIDVSPNQTVVAQGFDLGINVTAENQGQVSEDFNVTLYANTTVIQTEKNVIGLANGTSTTLNFTWDTTGVPLGDHIIWANITSIIADETDTADNNYTFGTISVLLPGAVDVTNVDVSHCGTPVNQAYKTWIVNVSVTILNNGSVPIGCTVGAYYGNASFNKSLGVPIYVDNLDPGNSTTLIFNWDFSPYTIPVGFNYTVKANATCTVGGASDEFVNGLIEKIPWGDVNNNGLVGFLDFGDVGKMYLIYSGVITSPPDLIARGDINGNCKIGFLDFGDVGKMYLIYSGVIS